MKILVSWSDASSRLLAEAICDWLPLALPNASPAMPPRSEDRLLSFREAGAALVCVTRSALDSNWLFFDLGALQRCLGRDAIVAPVLLDVAPEEISPTPLHVFQAARVVREDMLGLVCDLNQRRTPPLDDRQVEASFEKSWDGFHERSRRIPGYELRDFVVTVKLPSRTVSFTFKPARDDREWEATIGRFLRSLPRSPLQVPPFDLGTLHFLDVTSERWDEPPAILSRLAASHVAFIDPVFVEEWRGSSRLAAAVVRAAVGSKPPEWTVTQMGEKLALTRGIR